MRRCVHFLPPGRSLPPTPTRALPALARELGLAALCAKDESGRFGLNAFKLLGARFAIETLLAEGGLRRGATVVCASEGNHGRAVARAAREAGCAARVYMAHDAAPARADAIAGEGAEVIRVDGSYDDAVRILQADAAANGWTIVSDTAWPGYERIPFLIMLGYTRMMDEVRDQGSGIGDQGLRCGLRPGRRRRIAVRDRQLVRVSSAAVQGHRRRADRGGMSAGLGARRTSGRGRRSTQDHARRSSQSRSVAARVRIAAPERRCVHGDRRRVGARGDARARASRGRRSDDRRRRVGCRGARRAARALPRRIDAATSAATRPRRPDRSVLVIVSEGVTDPGSLVGGHGHDGERTSASAAPASRCCSSR